MPNIIIKNYEHFNTALPNWDTPKGKYIRTKEQYDRAVKEAGMVKYTGEEKSPKLKDYELSSKSRAIIASVKGKADKRGNVKLSDREIDALKSMGAIGKEIKPYMKSGKRSTKSGGFDK